MFARYHYYGCKYMSLFLISQENNVKNCINGDYKYFLAISNNSLKQFRKSLAISSVGNVNKDGLA